MTTYATPAQVAVELRGSTDLSLTEETQWQAWLERVERAIERRFERSGLVLADQVLIGMPTADDVADVEVAAVIRKIDNPRGLTSTTRSNDDTSITERREGVDLSGDPLTLTAADWASLLPAMSNEAFSTCPGFEPDSRPWSCL